MYTHEDIVQPRDRRAWTDEEDECLRAAIETEDAGANPPSKWHAIAKHIPNRTNKDCRKRWWAQMATRVSKGSWSSDEDERLFSAVDDLGTKWAAVASRVGTRNSGPTPMRRRNTRGSSASSTSSLSSPRSTVTPPPSSSSGVSSPESSGTPPTPDVYPIQQQLDYAGNWHRLKSEASVFDDLPALSLSPSTSRSSPSFAYSTSSPTDSQALDIFMNSSFNDFLDPSIDPSALASLHSTTSFPLGSCGSGPLLPEAADPWSTVQFPYTDFNSHGLPMDPHPMTTSMSGNMNNSSTPSHLCQPQFTTAGGLTLGRFMHSMREPQIGFSHFGGGASTGPGSVQDRAAMLYLQQQIDRHDHRTNMTLGMSDPYSVSSSLHHTGFSDTQ